MKHELEDTGSSALAAEIGVKPSRLRRELLLMELAGVAEFKRIGPSRVVSRAQVPQVLAWLARRGLLAQAPAGTNSVCSQA